MLHTNSRVKTGQKNQIKIWEKPQEQYGRRATKINLIMIIFAKQKLNRKLFVTQNNMTANKKYFIK